MPDATTAVTHPLITMAGAVPGNRQKMWHPLWPELEHWCATLCKGLAPGDKLLKNSIGRLRKHFVTAVKVFDGKTSRPEFAALLDRTNGATEHVHKTGFMRGRWANFATCKLYRDAALQ